MKTARSWAELHAIEQPLIIAAGNFDGVHLGHQAIFAKAIDEARKLGGAAWALTLDPHPARILRPEKAPRLITTLDQKLARMKAAGLDGCLVLPFDRELADTEPEEFIEQLAAHASDLREVVVGPNWTFGHRARGNPELLEKEAPKHGFKVSVMDPISVDETLISSTVIRQHITEGNMQKAADLLRRPFSLNGKVIHGRRLGRELGYPTANLDPYNDIFPPTGVYASYAVIEGRRWDGAGYLGKHPSWQENPLPFTVEVYLFDLSDDLYGKEMEIFFVQRIREDRRFPSSGQLVQQIEQDIESIRRALSAP